MWQEMMAHTLPRIVESWAAPILALLDKSQILVSGILGRRDSPRIRHKGDGALVFFDYRSQRVAKKFFATFSYQVRAEPVFAGCTLGKSVCVPSYNWKSISPHQDN